MSTQYIHYPNNNGGGGVGVTSLNGQTGALTLVAGSGITITPGAGTLTIAATGAGSGTVTSVAISTSTSALTITGSPITTAGTIDLEIATANSTTLGLLSAADWNTFNNKQPAGSYITALTGDATATGPGSVPITLATVNSNVGSFTNANITVNAKGLITAASNGTGGSNIILTGDVTGEGFPSFNTTVNSVGGATAAQIATAVGTTTAATPNDTPNTLVLRDSNANYRGKYNVSKYTLSGTDITNGFVTLPSAPLVATITRLDVIGGIEQDYSVDFTVISNQVSWTGLGLDGVLTAGDKIIVAYN